MIFLIVFVICANAYYWVYQQVGNNYIGYLLNHCTRQMDGTSFKVGYESETSVNFFIYSDSECSSFSSSYEDSEITYEEPKMKYSKYEFYPDCDSVSNMNLFILTNTKPNDIELRDCFDGGNGFYYEFYCGPGYGEKNEECLEKPDEEEMCKWYVDYCDKCDTSNNNVCTGCVSGYSLNEGKCFECSVSNCKHCSNSNYCDSCNDNYQKDNGNCIECNVSNCNHCSSINYCDSCNDNYQKNNGKCDPCSIANCKKCDDSFTSCSKCEEGYHPYSGKCESDKICHLGGCEECYYTSDGERCDKCEKGFYLENSQCESCKITNCVDCPYKDTCRECSNGYALIEGNCSEPPKNTISGYYSCGTTVSNVKDFDNTNIEAGKCYDYGNDGIGSLKLVGDGTNYYYIFYSENSCKGKEYYSHVICNSNNQNSANLIFSILAILIITIL